MNRVIEWLLTVIRDPILIAVVLFCALIIWLLWKLFGKQHEFLKERIDELRKESESLRKQRDECREELKFTSERLERFINGPGDGDI